jgi:hypothetical protein
MAQSTGRYGKIDPTKPMSPRGVHNWWYRRLVTAEIVPKRTTTDERMHKARHTAGQRVLDHTGNLRPSSNCSDTPRYRQPATSTQTGAWDQLAATMAHVLEDDRPTDNKAYPESFPLRARKPLQTRDKYRQRDSNPCFDPDEGRDCHATMSGSTASVILEIVSLETSVS